MVARSKDRPTAEQIELAEAQIVEQSKRIDFFLTEYSVELLAQKVRDGEYVATRQREDTTIEDLIALMVGRRMEEIYPPRLTPAPDLARAPALEVRGLSSGKAFTDVSFAVRRARS